jgi:prefoldin subunit 5
MDTLEGVYRQQYEQFTARESGLQQQIDDLDSVLNQIQTVIGQVNGLPTTDYAQQADRYQQLQLLLPSATRFSQEISQKQRQLGEVQQKKAELRSTILARQSDLPIWWRE